MKIKVADKVFNISENSINGFNLAKLASVKGPIVIKINGKLKDLSTAITTDCEVEFILPSSSEGLEVIRHSTAHLLAEAVVDLFPNTKVTIGPSIENGFYYDFDRKEQFSEHDFEKIEKKMKELCEKDDKFIRRESTKSDAIKYFSERGENYKVELIEAIPDNEILTIYEVGSFTDLCRGPHVPSTRYLKHHKLTKIAGAYWRGNSNNPMLQRIYGTAWDTKENLEKYFHRLEEAEKRDHRKIGKAMDLFHFEPDYAPGAPFFHNDGLFVFNKLIEKLREKQNEYGYTEIATPTVMNRVLWERSGHWEKYGAHNYSGQTEDGNTFCMKPMNCPGGVLSFKQGIKSYRDLPMRVAEFGHVHRYEASGALHGLFRVREFTQDDAHIYCTDEQVEEICLEITKFVMEVYSEFGFKEIRIKLSTRPEKRIGSEEIWDRSEDALRKVLENNGYDYTINEGEGAFYGPKLEFVLTDAIGRDWQAGTVQVDMNLPERFDIDYVGKDGQKHRPIMIHRAIFGSIERFMGILIEECEGKFPLWLAPTQVVVANISEASENYAREVLTKLQKAGIRAKADLRNEKINYKVREHSLLKAPYIFVVGEKEAENGSVAVRRLGSEKNEIMTFEDAIKELKK